MEPLRSDPVMATLVDEHGPVTLEPAEDPFERLIVSIINQQLSTESATAIRERVFDRFEITPSGVLAAEADELQAAGLSSQKIDYIQTIAHAHRDDRIDPDDLAEKSNEAVVDVLTEVRGIGVWTAKMYLMFCLAREDVFPVEDLGIRRAMTAFYDLDDRGAMVAKAEDWQPYRSYASLYLWRARD